MSAVTVIAEAGVNHNGDLDVAIALVEAAHAAGADFVKFQTFNADALATERAAQATYQVENTGQVESQLDLLRRLELSAAAHHRIRDHAEAIGITFFSTAFDRASLSFLTDDLAIPLLKIASGELTNSPFVLQHARAGRDLIVSTGMASLADVEQALSVIAFGMTADPATAPSHEAFQAAYASAEGRSALTRHVTLLHCTTAYPTRPEDVNLAAMTTMRRAFGLRVGYSDHTTGIAVPIAAVALGATVIEKHFTIDRGLPGPDHQASLEPDELKELVAGIREIELALGDGVKRPRPAELVNLVPARKSLVAAAAIRAGEPLSEDNMAARRPGDGVSPTRYWELLGTPARRDYLAGEPLEG